MWDLRWVLLGLGALVVVGVYLWSKGFLSRRILPQRARRAEPTIGAVPPPPATPGSVDAAPGAAKKPARSAPDRIITVRLIPRGEELTANRAVDALRSAGLQHGRYGIFHRSSNGSPSGEPSFSVASLTEPGTFDLDNLADHTVAGLSFFIVLPTAADPVTCFDSMVETARAMAVELESDLHDEGGSSWSIQRERYIREEIIEYRHQSGHH